MVAVNDISLTYTSSRNSAAALEQVNALFEKESFSAVIGPSGCGKTSLIKMMAGLLKPAGGTIAIDNSPVSGVRPGVAVIFQDYGLLPWKTVRANAELPLRLRARKSFNRKNVDALLELFGLKGFEKSYPRELSGGMKQRLAIVRALLTEPRLLLMDEPFSSLDNVTREDAQDFFLAVKKDLRLTIVMVSHSIEESVYLADTVYVMTGRNPGTIRHSMAISRDAQTHSRFRENPRFHEYCTALRKLLRTEARDPAA